MAYETIIYTVDAGIGRITINRPEAMNAITPGMLKELRMLFWKPGRTARSGLSY